jgi:hypothetical protein
MAELSIKQKAIARILELLEPLKAQGLVKKIARKKSLFLTEDVKPCLNVIVGPEDAVGQDNQGYEIQLAVTLEVILSAPKDTENLVDELTAAVQRAMESDRQLMLYANEVIYHGDQPYTNELMKPAGGLMILYQVNYRRQRAAPELRY